MNNYPPYKKKTGTGNNMTTTNHSKPMLHVCKARQPKRPKGNP